MCYAIDMPLTVKQVTFDGFGDPTQVLSLKETTVNPENLGGTQVLVRWLAAPVNPADVWQIIGEYGTLPSSFPAVPGIEGCGVVEKIGSEVTTLNVGDYVLGAGGFGTWRTHGIHESAQLVPFGKGLPTRDRPTIGDLKAELKGYGADEVYTEEEFKKALPEIPPARLALDCVGAESSLLLSSTLAPGGTLVNYGAMTGKPVQISPRELIFKNIRVVGYWVKHFYEGASAEDRVNMFTELVTLMAQGKLKNPPHTEHRLEDFAEAIKASRASTNSKHILLLSDE
ncbi:oxidoreductase [Aphelenchoides avenae]|nr:oxidoreductase [Aphelenchus avenae]